MRPQPPGATLLLLDTLLGLTVRKLTLAHCTVSHESSTKPPVSPEFAFQHLQCPACTPHSSLLSGASLSKCERRWQMRLRRSACGAARSVLFCDPHKIS